MNEIQANMIMPCDINRPFAFISYSNSDKVRVWEDVYEFQKRGYNIWIDTNLKATDNTWQEGALKAISNINCEIILFYLSENSATSKACLNELRQRKKLETLMTHNKKEIPLLIVDVTIINDISLFKDDCFQKIKCNSNFSNTEKNEKVSVLSELIDENIKGNDKLRIFSLDNPKSNLKSDDYYKKIVQYFDKVERYNGIKKYEVLIGLLNERKNYDLVMNCLEKIDEVPSVILLAFILKENVCGKLDELKAKELLTWLDMIPDTPFLKSDLSWLEKAMIRKEEGRFEQSVAYFIAYSMFTNNPIGYYEAGKIWMRLNNYEFTKKCLELAVRLGEARAKERYNEICKISEQEFHSQIITRR